MNLQVDSTKFIKSIEEMIAALCPSVIERRLSRIDTLSSHPSKSQFQFDRLYFASTKRRSFLREARYGEFDCASPEQSFVEWPSLAQSLQTPNELMRSMMNDVPRLWVLVTAIDNGVHHVSAIYRGEPKWKVRDWTYSVSPVFATHPVSDFNTDAELTDALKTIQACEGLDEAAYKRFYEKYKDASLLDAAIVPKNCGVAN